METTRWHKVIFFSGEFVGFTWKKKLSRVGFIASRQWKVICVAQEFLDLFLAAAEELNHLQTAGGDVSAALTFRIPPLFMNSLRLVRKEHKYPSTFTHSTHQKDLNTWKNFCSENWREGVGGGDGGSLLLLWSFSKWGCCVWCVGGLATGHRTDRQAELLKPALLCIQRLLFFQTVSSRRTSAPSRTVCLPVTARPPGTSVSSPAPSFSESLPGVAL